MGGFQVYAKIFDKIFDSSISSDYLTRHVFMDLLVLADRFGHVDMTIDAIARRTNVPEEIIAAAIEKLSQPDRRSRSPEEEGCRIALLDSHRDWGWRIVNFETYHAIRSEADRKDYLRQYYKRKRGNLKSASESTSTPQLHSELHTFHSVNVNPQLYTDADADTDTDVNSGGSEIPYTPVVVPPPLSAETVTGRLQEIALAIALPQSLGRIPDVAILKRIDAALAGTSVSDYCRYVSRRVRDGLRPQSYAVMVELALDVARNGNSGAGAAVENSP